MSSKALEILTRRRSSRPTVGQKQQPLMITTLRDPWLRHFIDVGHCRLKKCTKRVLNATSVELDYLGPNTFMAMSISAASAYGSHKEGLLISYANALLTRGIPPDDKHEGYSAVSLAAYHGYIYLLETLLQSGATLDNGVEHAVLACIRNGKHNALRVLTTKWPMQVSSILNQELKQVNGISSMGKAILKKDVESLQALRALDGAMLSDATVNILLGSQRNVKYFEVVLREFYPSIDNVWNWKKSLHWSFPQSDRETLNWLWHTLRRPSSPDIMPEELWLRVFSYVGRSWWVHDGEGTTCGQTSSRVVT